MDQSFLSLFMHGPQRLDIDHTPAKDESKKNNPKNGEQKLRDHIEIKGTGFIISLRDSSKQNESV